MTTKTEWAYSADGLTATPKGRNLPRTFTLPDGSVISGLTPERAPDFGWYPLRREPRQPYDDGYPKQAVIEGKEAVLRPTLPPDGERLSRALVPLRYRISAHRDRLVAIATTGLPHDHDGMGVDQSAVQRAQLSALMQANLLNLRLSEGTASADDIATIETMAAIPAAVQAISIAEAQLQAWVTAELTTWKAVDAFDPATPPPEAPQWPT